VSRARATRLVLVTAPGTWGDFAVSADSAFAELASLLAESLGVDHQPGAWHVAVDGKVLDPTATPAEAGVIDGDRLDLTTQAGPCVRLVERSAPGPQDRRGRRFGSATG
jgi:hypothetical protein